MTTYNLTVMLPHTSLLGAGLETFYERDWRLNEQEFAKVERMCDNRKNMAPFWKQTILPIRTDEVKDLLFPTLMNMVMKTKDLAENVFMVLGAIVLDLLTLPIRLITYLPRLAYNASAKPEAHPLIAYLEGKGCTFSQGGGSTSAWDSARPVEKGGRIEVLLYKQTGPTPSRFLQRMGLQYTLYLANREIAFPIYRKQEYVHAIQA